MGTKRSRRYTKHDVDGPQPWRRKLLGGYVRGCRSPETYPQLPPEREILALVLFGYPELIPKAPRRREIDILLHYDHYKGRLNWPSSDDPEYWTLEQIRDFQMAKIRNGARYNKPVPSERDAVLAALSSFIKIDKGRWLDVLPLTGLYTEEISRAYPDVEVTFTEMTAQVFEFIDDRTIAKHET